MPDVTPFLEIDYPLGSDAANTLDETLESSATAIDGYLYGLRNAAGIQEGVLGSGDGAVTRIDANTVRVAAGSGWVQADGTIGSSLTGLFPVRWAQTDITIPNTSVNKRIDRIVIPAVLDGSLAVPTRVAGSQTATPTHDNLTGAGSIPSGNMQIATVIASTTGVASGNVSNAGIRDRRPWARGAHAIASISTSDKTTTSTTSLTIDSGLMLILELSGAPLLVRLWGTASAGTADKWVEFDSSLNGVAGNFAQKHRSSTAGAEFSGVLLEGIISAPSAGYKTVEPVWKTESGVTATLKADSTHLVVWEAQELLIPFAQNAQSF